MTRILKTQRYCTALLAASTVVFAIGCRSAQVNSNPSPAPSIGGPAPFYRSYDRGTRPGDDNYAPLPPQPPVEILPVPGFSEPTPAIPPAPSSLRQRRPLFRSNRPIEPQEDRTNSSDQAEANLGETQPISGVRRTESIPLQTEPVPLKKSASNDSEQASRMPVRTRSGTINPWPSSRNAAPVDSSLPTTRQQLDRGVSKLPGEMPALLPPNS